VTVVAGIVDSPTGSVWLAGDSAICDDAGEIQIITSPKVFKRDNVVVGYAGSMRLGNLAYAMLFPPPYISGPPEKYMIREFARTWQQVVKDNNAEDENGDLLVGCGGELFFVGDNYEVHGYGNGIAAIGSGGHLAIGALWATKNQKNPRARLRTALTASVQYCNTIREPFVYVSV
jgi:ATP-dependent protease HslVU (ClpYQ) peptidase subunit